MKWQISSVDCNTWNSLPTQLTFITTSAEADFIAVVRRVSNLESLNVHCWLKYRSMITMFFRFINSQSLAIFVWGHTSTGFVPL